MRISANQSTALCSLQAILRGQQEFKAAKVSDSDNDGEGEFGSLGDLVADHKNPFIPRVLGTVDEYGRSSKSGYHFAVFLPETADGREEHFVAYAWPQAPGRSGVFAFVISETGVIGKSAWMSHYPSPTAETAFLLNPFKSGLFRPDWNSGGDDDAFFLWSFEYTSNRIILAIVAPFFIAGVVLLARLKFKGRGVPRKLKILPGMLSRIAALILFLTLGVWVFAADFDSHPSMIRMLLFTAAAFLAAVEAASLFSVGGAVGAVSSLMMIEIDTRIWGSAARAVFGLILGEESGYVVLCALAIFLIGAVISYVKDRDMHGGGRPFGGHSGSLPYDPSPVENPGDEYRFR